MKYDVNNFVELKSEAIRKAGYNPTLFSPYTLIKEVYTADNYYIVNIFGYKSYDHIDIKVTDDDIIEITADKFCLIASYDDFKTFICCSVYYGGNYDLISSDCEVLHSIENFKDIAIKDNSENYNKTYNVGDIVFVDNSSYEDAFYKDNTDHIVVITAVKNFTKTDKYNLKSTYDYTGNIGFGIGKNGLDYGKDRGIIQLGIISKINNGQYIYSYDDLSDTITGVGEYKDGKLFDKNGINILDQPNNIKTLRLRRYNKSLLKRKVNLEPEESTLDLDEALTTPFTGAKYEIGEIVYVDLQQCISPLPAVTYNMHSKTIFNNIAVITGYNSDNTYNCNIGQKIEFAPKYAFDVSCPESGILGKVSSSIYLFYNIDYKPADAIAIGPQTCIIDTNIAFDIKSKNKLNILNASGALKNGAFRIYGEASITEVEETTENQSTIANSTTTNPTLDQYKKWRNTTNSSNNKINTSNTSSTKKIMLDDIISSSDDIGLEE